VRGGRSAGGMCRGGADPDEGRRLQGLPLGPAAEDAGQVEAEAVHVVL